MTHWKLMYEALKNHVFPCLREKGFEGVYPHFRRSRGDAIELISFAANPRGGSLGISVSVAFPSRKNTNLIWPDNMENLTAFHTRVRYSGMGMFERPGDFYYADVYRKHIWKGWFRSGSSYVAVLNEDAARQWMEDGYECVRHFGTDTPNEMCTMILTQLEGAFSWMEKFEKKNRR